MRHRYLYNADGELLIVPEPGGLRLSTELGEIEVEPQEIGVLPRGLRFRVELLDFDARGYICENRDCGSNTRKQTLATGRGTWRTVAGLNNLEV